MTGLTERQAEILEFVKRYTAEHGMPPTVREIGEEFDIASTNAVIDHLRAIARKGFMREAKGRARAWRAL